MFLLPLSFLLLKNTSSQANILSSKIVKKNQHLSKISSITLEISTLLIYQTSLALIELSMNLLPHVRIEDDGLGFYFIFFYFSFIFSSFFIEE